ITGCAFSAYISTISLLLLVQPNLFENEVVEKNGEKSEQEAESKLRYVELSSSAAEELGEKLNALMLEHRPHLDADISLAKLASMLVVTTHQLSELLNIHMETSFYDFLNSLRYKEALRLMSDSPNSYNITDIAYLSGFNNRNSF